MKFFILLLAVTFGEFKKLSKKLFLKIIFYSSSFTATTVQFKNILSQIEALDSQSSGALTPLLETSEGSNFLKSIFQYLLPPSCNTQSQTPSIARRKRQAVDCKGLQSSLNNTNSQMGSLQTTIDTLAAANANY